MREGVRKDSVTYILLLYVTEYQLFVKFFLRNGSLVGSYCIRVRLTPSCFLLERDLLSSYRNSVHTSQISLPLEKLLVGWAKGGQVLHQKVKGGTAVFSEGNQVNDT